MMQQHERLTMPTLNWDDAFAKMAHVQNSHTLPDFWAKCAAAYRADLPPLQLQQDVAYGDGARQKLDIIWPEGVVQGLAVFVHGGYWMRLDKSHWTDLAECARSRGWAVCILSYTLAPEACIAAITAEIGLAIITSAAHVHGPICLAGHSTGGHLVTRMLYDDSLLPAELQKRIQHTLSISGLHDLRPLMRTQMNKTLHIDAIEARLESPVMHNPKWVSPLTCWVGNGERLSLSDRQSL
jgi:arylformamidase